MREAAQARLIHGVNSAFSKRVLNMDSARVCAKIGNE